MIENDGASDDSSWTAYDLAARVVPRLRLANGSAAHPGSEEERFEEVLFLLRHLEQASSLRHPELFTEYLRWAAGRLGAVDDLLAGVEEALRVRGGARASPLLELLRASRTQLDREAQPAEAGEPLGPLARSYLDDLLALRRQAAVDRILDAFEAGVAVPELYLHTLQPALREVGRLWQENEISVALEHYCSAATQFVMALLYQRMERGDGSQGLLMAVGVQREVHEIGLRMVSDLFELEGWHSIFLGTNVPVGGVLEAVRSHRPQLLAVSATTVPSMGMLTALVRAMRQEPAFRSKPILVGGAPFLRWPDLWRQVGADGFARDAVHAVERGRELVRRRES